MLNQNLTTTIITTTSEDPVKLLHQAFEAQLHSNCLRQDVDILNRVRIRYYEMEYIVLEKEFIEIAQNIKCANTTTMNYNYLDEPSVEMGNLLLITCSFIESIAADMDLTLDSIYSPVTYISTGNSEHDELLEKYLYSLEIHNFYEINHILLFPHKNQHNQQNHPTTKQPNTQPKRKPSDNIIKPQNCQDSKNVSTTTTTKTKQEYRHFDYDCLSHLHHRLGISDKKLYIKLEYLPKEIQHNEELQFPLRNAHKYYLRPQWCKAYQSTKHYRLNNLHLGTGKTVLQALGAFYLLCLYAKNILDAIVQNDLLKNNKSMTKNISDNITDQLQKMTIHSSLFAPYIACPKIEDIPKNIDLLDNSLFSNQQELRQAVFILRDPKTDLNSIDRFVMSEDMTENKDELVEILELTDYSLIKRELFSPLLTLNTFYRYEYIISYNSIKNIISTKTTKSRNSNKNQKYNENYHVYSTCKETSDDIYDYQKLQEKLKELGLWQ